MGISLPGFGIEQKGIYDIKEHGFGMAVEGFDVFQPFNCLLVISGMFALPQLIIYRHIKHPGNF